MGAGAAFGFVRGVFLVWLMAGLLAVLPVASLGARRASRPSCARSRRASHRRSCWLPSWAASSRRPACPMSSSAHRRRPTRTSVTASASNRPTRLPPRRDRSTLRVEARRLRQLRQRHSLRRQCRPLRDQCPCRRRRRARCGSRSTARFDRHAAHVVMIDPRSSTSPCSKSATGSPSSRSPLAAEQPARGAPAAATRLHRRRRRASHSGRHQPLDRGARTRHLWPADRCPPGDRDARRRAAGRQRRPADARRRHVGGVTFSESRDNPDIGYALSPSDVQACHRAGARQPPQVDYRQRAWQASRAT